MRTLLKPVPGHQQIMYPLKFQKFTVYGLKRINLLLKKILKAGRQIGLLMKDRGNL